MKMNGNFLLSVVALLVVGCLTMVSLAPANASSMTEVDKIEPEKGPHRGRMLRDNEFAVELAIFETGVPPEFRVWVTNNGRAVQPNQVDLKVELTRLGDVIDRIGFTPQNDFLRGDLVVYEPHSFVVTLRATYQGKSYQWEYENFEGRTKIEHAVANAMNIQTGVAGEARLHQTLPVYGVLALPPGSMRSVSARFDGEISRLHVHLGETVQKGQTLLTIESNESLKPYPVKAMTAGVISGQFANGGEQTSGRTLLTITDDSEYVAKLAVYPTDYQKVKVGSKVTLTVDGINRSYQGEVSFVEPQVRDDQARIVWVRLSNNDHRLTAGSFVSAEVEVATFDVPLAVKRDGLQSFRDFIVVYAKVGEEYEVRMLELGRQDGEWVEVLGGLKPGTEYVTQNSYVLKADIEKSGASHDH